jgi:hypothetical protein
LLLFEAGNQVLFFILLYRGWKIWTCFLATVHIYL